MLLDVTVSSTKKRDVSPCWSSDIIVAHKYLPTLEDYLTTHSDKLGWECDFYNHDSDGNPVGDSVGHFVLNDTLVKLNDFLPPGLTATWTMRLSGKLKIADTGSFEFGLTVAGERIIFHAGSSNCNRVAQVVRSSGLTVNW